VGPRAELLADGVDAEKNVFLRMPEGGEPELGELFLDRLQIELSEREVMEEIPGALPSRPEPVERSVAFGPPKFPSDYVDPPEELDRRVGSAG
jgi:hypothetical protein